MASAFGSGETGRLVASCALLGDGSFSLDGGNPKREDSDEDRVGSSVGISRWTGVDTSS